MSDYSNNSHQELYDYVFSGSPSNVESEANLNKSHAKSVTDATTDLQNTLTKIQSSWSGAAADQFSQQANSIVQRMQDHAQTADNTSTWMNYVSQSLTWAQQNIPSPPSGAEQDLAAVNNNSVTEWGLGLLTDGASYVASKAAQQDIANKKAAATSVMTQLASAYSTANSNLEPNRDRIGGGNDTDPVTGNGNSKGDQSGNGNSSNGSGSGAGMIMPMPMAMPIGSSGGETGSSARVSTGSYANSRGSGTSGVNDPLSTSTVTSGLGDLPNSGGTSGTSSGISGIGDTTGYPGGTTTGSGFTNGGLNGVNGLGSGGLNEYGGNGVSGPTEGETETGGLGRLGSGKLGSGGLGGGVLGEEGGGGAYGSTGLGSGTSRSSALSGGTGTGELGEEAGGTGYGTQAGASSGSGSGSGYGTGAAGAAGEAEGANSSQNNMMGGGMGGMGRGGGGGGGGQGERGNRASWLKEDPDYWYGDKMKNAAPPGGVIE